MFRVQSCIQQTRGQPKVVSVWGLTAVQQYCKGMQKGAACVQVVWMPAAVLPVPAATFALQRLPPEHSELHQSEYLVVIQVYRIAASAVCPKTII